MCGIAGYVSPENWPGSKMTDAIAHRGPDGKGAYAEPWGDLNVFIGHRRLAIIDLSENGHQPMISHRRTGVIAFNGEIYNFRELKKELVKSVPFRSETDTEVLLELLAQQGISALQQLNGDFAIAYLDRDAKKFYLVRDRMGVKPLYYRWHNGSLHFGSEIKAILAAGIPAELESDHVQRYFTFKYSPGSETLYRYIKRLPPAHYIEMDLQSKEVSVHQYWSPQSVDVAKDYPGRCEQLRDLLKRSVELRLEADVPVSTFLSGGLDSSVIASLIKDNSQIMHYCAVKNETDIKAEGTTSDAAYADQLAKEWNLNFERIPIGSEVLTPELIQTTLKFSDDLIADGSQIPSYLITSRASEKSTVVLTGMGADELFYGYGGHIITRWAGSLDKFPVGTGNLLAKMMAGVHPGKGKFKAVKRYLYKLGRYYQHPHRFAPLSVVGDWNNSMQIFDGNNDSVWGMLQHYSGSNDLQKLEQFERENFLVKNLHYMDRMSMANQMESRVPFLDHRLVEWAYSLSLTDRINGLANTKRILKDSFERDLPRDIVRRRKAGFGMPLRSLLSKPETVKALLSPSFFANFDGFSPVAIRRVIEEHQRGIADHSSIIYALISFEHWYKMYITK